MWDKRSRMCLQLYIKKWHAYEDASQIIDNLRHAWEGVSPFREKRDACLKAWLSSTESRPEKQIKSVFASPQVRTVECPTRPPHSPWFIGLQHLVSSLFTLCWGCKPEAWHRRPPASPRAPASATIKHDAQVSKPMLKAPPAPLNAMSFAFTNPCLSANATSNIGEHNKLRND
jgi:hypothetical protein